MVAWTSGAAWFDALMDALNTPAGEQQRRAVKVARDTLLRVARAEWLSADVATGRGVTTAHETLAAELGMSKRTVQRCRELIEALGFAITVETGRYLTTAERAAARKVHGGRQYRAASVRALTLPLPHPVENVHLPSPREGESLTPALKSSPRRADARRTAAPRPQPGSKGRNADHRPRAPRALVDQRLAGELDNRLPWLAQGRHIGTISDLLRRIGVSGADWTAHGLLSAVETYCQTSGVKTVDPRTHRDPVAYFAWLVRSALADGAEPTRRRHDRQAQQRAAERAARAAEAQREAERVAAIDWEAVEAIQQQMRQQFATPVAARRSSFRPFTPPADS